MILYFGEHKKKLGVQECTGMLITLRDRTDALALEIIYDSFVINRMFYSLNLALERDNFWRILKKQNTNLCLLFKYILRARFVTVILCNFSTHF